ncbi:MAG: hypothetical protein P4L74_05485 [Candidatus Doudnabacteria bacterium]|nr:hypothetical protein [Candidatus Doudnabacteria bacterium]
MKFLKFVLIGLLFAAPGEILIRRQLHQGVADYIKTMLIYVFWIAIIIWPGIKLIAKFFKKSFSQTAAGYIIFGFLGLMVEWFLINNSPWAHPDASQIGMFTFWTSLFMAPTIILSAESFVGRLKSQLLKYFSALSVIYLLLALGGGNNLFGALIIFTYGSWLLNYFYLKYLYLLKHGQ